MSRNRKKRIVKLGGSLLSRDGLPCLLTNWLESNSDMQNIVVVGGGELADTIRRLQHTLILTDACCHRLACRTMSLNAEAVAKSLPDCLLVDRFDDLSKHDDSVIVFDSLQWISGRAEVPKVWDFTSDSIAAMLATEVNADQLVVIKSRMGEITEPGFVDPCFAAQVASIPDVRICTLEP